MQNQVSAKSLVRQLMVNAIKILPHEDGQRLIDLFVLVDRLENQVRKCTDHHHSDSMSEQRPQAWVKRVQLHPQQNNLLHNIKKQ